jgi:filamentous hemagglutinin family protein
MTVSPHTHRLLHALAALLLSGWLLLRALLASSQAQVPTAITPDGSLGTSVTRSGTVYNIHDGTIKGPNLFHSFNRFSIGTGDTARFTGPSGIVNILSRVTGGERSAIDGTLASTIDGANLYLLNPAGVLFGPNARLDVQGAFHVSTADFLRLSDGGIFHTTLGQESVLTVAPPVAFGFLRENPAGITMQGSGLEVPAGKTLAAVGGEVQMVGGSLKAPNGQIHLASVTAVGEVPTNLSELKAGTAARLGAVALSEGARLDTSSVQGGGTVVIRGGRLFMDNARIRVATEGDVNGAPTGVDVQVAGEVVLTNQAEVTTDVGPEVSALPPPPLQGEVF